MTTIWQDNVTAFAQRPGTRFQLEAERHATVDAAMADLLRFGPGRAFYTLMRGVRRQWLFGAGVGELQLGPEATPSEILDAWDGGRP